MLIFVYFNNLSSQSSDSRCFINEAFYRTKANMQTTSLMPM